MRDAWASTLREQWRIETVDSVWLRPGDWYHPAVDALAEALSAGANACAAAGRLGEVRGAAGVGIAETLDDVGVLFRIIGRDPGLDVVRALCEGWAGAIESAPVQVACMDPESGLPTAEYLGVRLGETYGAAGKHAHYAFHTHCLVLIDVASHDLAPWRRMALESPKKRKSANHLSAIRLWRSSCPNPSPARKMNWPSVTSAKVFRPRWRKHCARACLISPLL